MLVSNDPVKFVFGSIGKSRRLDKVPNMVMSMETDFEPALKVKFLSATLVM